MCENLFQVLDEMVAEAERVKTWLSNHVRISVPNDWLEACIDWIHSENDVIFFIITRVVFKNAY